MNAPLQGHTASNLHTTGPLLAVDNVSLEYRTPERVVRATHQVSFEIDPADLQPGDGILMRVASPVTNHGAVYLGDNRIIHHVQNRLSCRDIYSEFWRQRTTHVLRHENHHSAG